MAVKDDELTRLQLELTTVEESIANIVKSGQSFRKGGAMGFAVEQVKLSELRAERTELRNKLAVWGMYNV